MDNNAIPGISVEQAVQRLAAIAGSSAKHLKLVVPYEAGQVMIGCKPAVPVEDFTLGFDWDHGKVFAHPVLKIRGPVLELEKEQLLVRRAVNAIGSIAMHVRNERISPEHRLRLISEAIERFNCKDESAEVLSQQ